MGYKQIQVNIIMSGKTHNTKEFELELASLLHSITANSVSVDKSANLFKEKFHRSISISDLYKFQDIIEINE